MSPLKMQLLVLALFLAGVQPKFTGFESNINRMITSYKILIEDVERGFSRLVFYFDNLDNYSSNEQLFTATFTDSLNQTIEGLEDSKPAIYDSLQTLLADAFFVFGRRAVFHTYLLNGYDEVVQFVATMDAEDIDKTLKDLFKEFLLKKNLFFFDITNLKDLIENTAVNLVNAFDMIETFVHDTMLVDGKVQRLTVKQVSRFYFIPGLLSQLREYYQTHNELLEGINKAFVSLEDSVEEMDEYLSSLKFYYYRRYVDGFTEEQINNLPQEQFSEQVESDSSAEEEAKAVEDQRDPIDVCDQVLLGNFGLKGLTTAAEVSEFEKLQECPSIKNSCCSQSELTSAYKSYFDTKFQVLVNKMGLAFAILDKLLNNYSILRDLAYKFIKDPRSSEQCREVGRKVIFTPISADFVRKFVLFMTNAHEFIQRSRASALCLVCDYEFHKSMQEEAKVRLSPAFCSAMMANVFDYVSLYNLQLIDYFNSLVDLVQCDAETGRLKKDVLIEFPANVQLSEVLEKCQAHKNYCLDFCKEFKFLTAESGLDVDVPLLRQFYHLLEERLRQKKTPMTGSVSSTFFASVGAVYSLERIELKNKSLDNLQQEYEEGADAEGSHNPFLEGTKLLKRLQAEQEEEE